MGRATELADALHDSVTCRLECTHTLRCRVKCSDLREAAALLRGVGEPSDSARADIIATAFAQPNPQPPTSPVGLANEAETWATSMTHEPYTRLRDSMTIGLIRRLARELRAALDRLCACGQAHYCKSEMDKVLVQLDAALADRDRLDAMEHHLAFAQRLRGGWYYELMDGENEGGLTLRDCIDTAKRSGGEG